MSKEEFAQYLDRIIISILSVHGTEDEIRARIIEIAKNIQHTMLNKMLEEQEEHE
jgi:hypothetical protein